MRMYHPTEENSALRFYVSPKVKEKLKDNGIYINKFFEMLNDDELFNYVLDKVPIHYEFRRPQWLKDNGYNKSGKRIEYKGE